MSITTALKARREQLRDREAGFTLIELLVVVIIIGILAAIAIPVYIGVQNSAKDSSATSDLANAKIAVQAQYSANNAWVNISTTAATNVTNFGNYGWSGTTAVDASTTAGGSATAWCIKETSGSNTVFYVTQSSAPTSTKPSGCA
jgi:type IV pilus assembly protein PilA